MAQFTVYENTNPATRAALPLLLNVQSNLIRDLNTRVVVPLAPAAEMQAQRLRVLTPLLEIDGEQYLMLTPQMAGIPTRLLGSAVADLSIQRDEIVAALDLLITGI